MGHIIQRRAFVDGLIDNDEKVASSKKIINKTTVQKKHTPLMIRTAEKPVMTFGASYT